MRAIFALKFGRDEWTRESASAAPAQSRVADADPHLIRRKSGVGGE